MKIKYGIAAAAALFFLLITGAETFAASPGRISYQGTLRKNGVLFSGTTPMVFRITNADSSVEYWTSGSTEVVVSTGLFRYALGTPNDAAFDAIVWKEITPYVQMRLDGEWLPSEPLYSSVYSLHSKTAESSTGTFTINGGDLKLTAATGTKGIYFQDGTSQFTSPGWAASGQSVGLTVSGNVGVGTLSPATKLDVRGVNLDPYVQFWRDSSGVIQASMTAAGRLYGDGSQLRNLPAGADDLGSHIATTNLNLNTFNLVNVASITASASITSQSSITVSGPLGLRAIKLTLAPGVEVSSASAGGVNISGNVFLPAGAKYYGDGSVLGGVHDSLGTHIATQTLNMGGNAIINVSSVIVTSGLGVASAKLRLNPNVEISSASALNMGGVFITTHVYLDNNAKYYGDGSALTGIVGVDNLGNHILLQNLQAGSNWLSYDGSDSGLSFDAAGNVGLGTPAGASARLDVRGSGNPVQFWRNGAAVVASMTATGLLYADGSQLRNLQAGGTANRPLNMASFAITNVSTITVSSITSSGVGVVFSTNMLLMNGRLGIDTMNPQEKLHVQGSILSSMLGGSGNRCVYVDDNGVLLAKLSDCGTAAGAADSLGTHQMTQNLKTGAFWISNDGGNEGLTVTALGKVGVGLSGALANLDVQAAAGDAYAQIWRDAGGLDVASMSATGFIYADASRMRNLPSGGDSFGSHTATKTVDMGGNQLMNVASLTLNPSVEISSDSSAGFAGLRVSSNVYIVGFSSAARYYGDGSQLTNIAVDGDDLGSHTAALNLNMASFDIASVSTITVSSVTSSGVGVVFSTNVLLMNGRLGIDTLNPQQKLHVQGSILSSMLGGSGNRCVYVDDNGVLLAKLSDCGTAAGAADSLGTHQMTQNLKTGAFWISNDGGDEGITITNTGKVGVGISGAAASLDVQAAGADTFTQIWRDNAGVIKASMTVDGLLYADASKMSNLPSGADNLGNHTATLNLNMASKEILAVSTITAGYLNSSGAGVVFTTNALVMGGRLGINTTAPRASLDVNGSLMSSSLSGSGDRCVTADDSGRLYLAGDACGSAAGLDNMGDQIMMKNLLTNNHWINGDLDEEGIWVDAAGNVSIGTNTATAKLDVKGSVGGYIQTWRSFGDVIQASMSATGVLWADGSKLRNLPLGADSLGTHIATTTLKMANFPIVNIGSITVNGQFTTYSSATVAGALGLGAARLALNPVVEISSDSSAGFAGLRVSSNVYVVGFSSAAKYYGDGSSLSGVNDSLGSHIAAQDLNMAGYQLLNVSSVTVTGPGIVSARLNLGPNVEISSEAAAASGAGLRISSNVYIVGFSSAAKYYGDGSSLTGVISSPDGMGNHTAAQNLNMSSFDINNVSTITANYLSSLGAGVAFTTNAFVMGGRMGVNTALPQASLDVNGNIMSSSLSGSGNQCVYADNTGRLLLSMVGDCGSAAGNDNLGNHKLTQNLETRGNWISYDGANSGLSVNVSSNVGIGILSAATRLDVQAAGGLDPYVQIWRNSGGVETASMTASGILYVNGSGLRNMPAEADPIFTAHPANAIAAGDVTNWNTAYGWGNHTAPGYAKVIATQDMNLNNFSLVNVSSITAASGITSSSVTVTGELAVGTGVLSPAAGLYGGIAISTNVNLAAGAKLYLDGVEVSGGGGDNLGLHLATQDLDLDNFNLINVASITARGTITSYSSVTINGELGVSAGMGNDYVQFWRNSSGMDVASMTAYGIFKSSGVSIFRLVVGNEGVNTGDIAPSVLAMVYGVMDEADLRDDPTPNVGVLGAVMVNPSTPRIARAIGGLFRAGIADGNTQNFPKLIGVMAGANPRADVTVAEAYGILVQSEQLVGHIDDNYGIDVKLPITGAGTMANNYGIYVRDQSGISTVGFNIYSADNGGGASSRNYFGGVVEAARGVQLKTTAAQKPACDSTVRGMIWLTPGVGAAADVVQVCAKDADVAYSWHALY